MAKTEDMGRVATRRAAAPTPTPSAATTYSPAWTPPKKVKPGTSQLFPSSQPEQPAWLGNLSVNPPMSGFNQPPTTWKPTPQYGIGMMQQPQQAVPKPANTQPNWNAARSNNIPAGMTLAQWTSQNMGQMPGNVFNPSAPGTTRQPARRAGGTQAGESFASYTGMTPLPGTNNPWAGELTAANQGLYDQIGQALEQPNPSGAIQDLQYQQWLQSQLGLVDQGAGETTAGFGSRYKGWRRGRGGYGGYGGYDYGNGSNYVPPAYANLFSWNYGE